MKLTLEQNEKDLRKDVEISADEIMTSGNTIREESLSQWQKMKDRPLFERIKYILTYYGIAILAVAVVIIVIISVINAVTSYKEYGYYSIMVNSASIDSTKISESFADYAKIDLNEYNCEIDTLSTLSQSGLGQGDVSTSTKIVASVQGGMLDCIIMDPDNFEIYSLNNIFGDLREQLPDDVWDKYKDNIYYEERQRIEEWNDPDNISNDRDAGNHGDAAGIKVFVDKHKDPSNMKDPVPLGIIISDSSLLTDSKAYPDVPPIMGFVQNSTHRDLNLKFLQYLYDDRIAAEDLLF